MTDQYFVIGNPVEHSRSPEIHRMFAEQTGQKMYYGKFLAPEGGFGEALTALIDEGIRGANITDPFKEDAFVLCSDRTDRAERARAINTLVVNKEGKCLGDNTDGAGMLTDLIHNHQIELKGKHIMVLGAGGAVRGVIEPLLDQQPECLLIANRTPEKARALADDFRTLGNITGGGFDDLGDRSYDVIINGTSAGLQGKTPPIAHSVLRDGGVTYDMLYGSEPTPFVRWGQDAGASKALDGLGMLVEQAAQSFYLWRAQRPDTRAVIEHLRK